ncbi:MAG: hypothetical protein A2Y65_08285 [Deltaproteobacteria bacterium RBG_13_52_11]|nr:MAG: hypothetical protein A2Y65_08285 [Deltaproteobacteria bacterium RBG_13_52_11]
MGEGWPALGVARARPGGEGVQDRLFPLPCRLAASRILRFMQSGAGFIPSRQGRGVLWWYFVDKAHMKEVARDIILS